MKFPTAKEVIGLFSSTERRPEQLEDGTWWYPQSDAFSENGKYLKDALEVPEVLNVIQYRAKAMASGAMDAISDATGKPAPNREKIVKLLRFPNFYQAYTEFWRLSSIWRDIYANEYIYLNRPYGMPSLTTGMFTIPPFMVELEYTGSDLYFQEADGENLRYYAKGKKGTRVELEKENLIHLNDSVTSAENPFLGVSKLKTLQPAIKNIRRAYEKRNIVLGLPVGIFSQAAKDAIGVATPMDPKEKKAIDRSLKRKGASPVTTGLALNYNALDANPTNMGLFEEVREDLGKICDAYGVPYKLLANTKTGNSLNSSELRETKKQFYEDTIIPDVQEKVDALNLKLGTFAKAWTITAMWDHLPVFSQDQKERASALKLVSSALTELVEAELITQDEARAELAKFEIYGNK